MKSLLLVATSQYKQRSLIPMPNADAVLQSVIDEKGAIKGFGIKFCFSEPMPSMKFTRPLKMAFDCDWTEISISSNDDEDDTMALDSVAFDATHFHEKSMTFHGKLSFANPVMCTNDKYFYDQLECSLNFSDNCHYIRRGLLRWKFASTPVRLYPLDGAWEVQYTNGDSTIIFVQKHSFTCFGYEYSIAIDEMTHCPQFSWTAMPGEAVLQVSNQPIFPGDGGPGVGETLEWETNSMGYERIVWKRHVADLDNFWRSVNIKAGNFVYQKCNQQGDGQSLGPSYHADTLWGNTFCQLFTVGMASYHFMKDPDIDGTYQAYISYESPRTEAWPSLDNGETVPARVPFRNVQWGPETRTFKGDICWEEDYNTTWMSESKWSYEIVFDPNFMFVASGAVLRAMGEPHQFGSDLVYINAALETPLREIRETTQSTGAYFGVIRQCRDSGGASPGTLEMLGEVAMTVMDDRESVFDFNL